MTGETRRELLGGVGASLVALAGCTSSDRRQTQHGELVSGTFTIEGGDHRSWDFYASADLLFEYSFTVQEGPAIDVLLMREYGYNDYTEGAEFAYYIDGSVMDSTGDSVEYGLGGENIYYLVLDNTAMGETEPPAASEDAVATVELTAEITPV